MGLPTWTSPSGPTLSWNRILGAATIDRLRNGGYRIVLEGKSYRSTKPVPKHPKTGSRPEKTIPKGGENE
jgi:hypothetical protein